MRSRIKKHVEKFKKQFSHHKDKDIEYDEPTNYNQPSTYIPPLPTPAPTPVYVGSTTSNDRKQENVSSATTTSHMSSPVFQRNSNLGRGRRLPRTQLASSPQRENASRNGDLDAEQLAYFRQLHDEAELNKIKKEVSEYRDEDHQTNNEKRLEMANYKGAIPENFLDPITQRLMDNPVKFIIDNKNNERSDTAIDKTSADTILKEKNPRDPYKQKPVSRYVEDRDLKLRIDAWVNQVAPRLNYAPNISKFGLYNNNNRGNEEHEYYAGQSMKLK